MTQTIRDISAKKGTKTPIAEALSKVPRDLRAAEGHRVVVLVTDGKEDCGGDPAKAIKALAVDGTTTTVSIVGYALGDDAADVKAELTDWAMLGGGHFYDAPDEAGLKAALSSALAPPYLVYDETGAFIVLVLSVTRCRA